MAINLTTRTIRGFKWSYLSAIVNVVLITGMTAILARLLDPSAFGLIAMANILLRFASYFTSGIEPAIIQKTDLSPTDIRSSFTLSAIVSSLICALVFVLAPFATRFMASPEIVPIVRMMALTMVISGLSVTAVALLKRELGFRKLAIIEIIAYVAGYCGVGLAMAMNGFGIWSLVGASLTQGSVTGLLAYLFTLHSCRPSMNRAANQHIFSFGGKASILGFLEFLGLSMDSLFIGRLLGPAALGVYTRAMALIEMPIQAISVPLLKVTFPAMSQVQLDYAKLREAYGSTITMLTVISLPIAAGIIPAAPNIVLTLLGSKWTDAIPVLQILAVFFPIAMTTVFVGSLCTVTGRLNGRLWIQIAFVILLPFAIYSVADRSLVDIAIVVVGAHAARFVAYFCLVHHILGFTLRLFCASLLPGLIAAIAVFITISAAHVGLAAVPAPLALLVEIVVGAITLLSVIAIIRFQVMVQILDRLASQSHELGVGRHLVDLLSKRYAA